jgi:hypothetical protein
VAALREDEGQTTLYCQAHPDLPGNDLASLPGLAGEVHVLLAKTGSACTVCKGPRFTVLKSADEETPPACFDCLTRPGRV